MMTCLLKEDMAAPADASRPSMLALGDESTASLLKTSQTDSYCPIWQEHKLRA